MWRKQWVKSLIDGAGKSAMFKYIGTTERKKGNLVLELSPEEYSYELLSEYMRTEKEGS